MRRARALASWCLLAALLLFSVAGEAEAYLDPGTGSYILQILIASLLAAGFTLKIFWRQVKFFVVNLFSRKKGTGDDAE
jgi:hypothetical protein